MKRTIQFLIFPLLGALVYDTMILKRGWNDATDRPFTQLIEPSSFGVFREDTYSFEDQQAMVHKEEKVIQDQ